MLGCLLETLFICFWPTCPLVTIFLLDLVITLAKSSLVLIFSVEDTSVWAFSFSWQPSVRAFSWWSFVMSFLHRSWPIFSLVVLETPFLTCSSFRYTFHLSHLHYPQIISVSLDPYIRLIHVWIWHLKYWPWLDLDKLCWLDFISWRISIIHNPFLILQEAQYLLTSTLTSVRLCSGQD